MELMARDSFIEQCILNQKYKIQEKQKQMLKDRLKLNKFKEIYDQLHPIKNMTVDELIEEWKAKRTLKPEDIQKVKAKFNELNFRTANDLTKWTKDGGDWSTMGFKKGIQFYFRDIAKTGMDSSFETETKDLFIEFNCPNEP